MGLIPAWLTVVIKSRNRISRFRGFLCHCSLHYEIPIPNSPMAYLPCNFCRSDGYWSFRKFGWYSTVTIFLLLCKLLLRAFSSMRMFSSMLFLLCFYVQIPKFCISCHFCCCHQRQQSSTRIRCLFNICQQICRKLKNQKRRTPGEREEFVFKKSLGSELLKILKLKECTGNRCLHETKLRRDNTFHKC